MPETVFSNPRQGAFSSVVSHLQHAFHFDTPEASSAFTNPAITFEPFIIDSESNESAEPYIPCKSGALPPLWQLFRQAAHLVHPTALPLTAFANPAVVESQPMDWVLPENEPKRSYRAKQWFSGTESWHDHAKAYFTAGQYESAVECADQALELKPDDHAVWRLRGLGLLALQRWDEASNAFQHAIATNMQDAESWLGLGRAQLQLGEAEAALQSLAQALTLIPHYFEAWFYQGRAYVQLLDYERACASYAQAVELNGEIAVVWREYAEALLCAQQPEAALECFETVTQLQPANADHWVSYGSLLHEMLQLDEAVNSYDIALKLAPRDFFAWFSRGLALSDMARHEDAGKSFEGALSIAPGDAAAQYQLALTYLPRFLSALAEGRLFDAHEYWQRAIRLGRASHSADWHELELYYLQRAAALGHQQLVKALLNCLDGNALLEPLRLALDYLQNAMSSVSQPLTQPGQVFSRPSEFAYANMDVSC